MTSGITKQLQDSSPIRYASSSSAVNANRTADIRSESSGLFVRSSLSGPPGTTARNRRHDIDTDLIGSGSGRRRRLFVDENGMPVGNEGLPSDTATFSNLDPNTSDADVLGGASTRVIWGTNVSILDSMNAMKDFLLNFQKKYRMIQDGELQEGSNLPADHPGNVKEYVDMMKTMLELGVTPLNLDARNLKSYPPTRKLWHQLQSFPNEIIPLMDVAVKDVMIELAEKRMNELRLQQPQGQRAQQRPRDSSSIPPMPSSDIDNQPSTPAAMPAIAEIPDLVREVDAKIYRVRPFGLDHTVNLRDLNPGGKWNQSLEHAATDQM